jgi:hypothetical protein
MADSLPIPPFPAVEVRPSRIQLERGVAAFRAEMDAAADRSGQALLAHHLGRLFAQQQDFAASAREELAATNLATGFAAPLEALWAIAIRGRSRKNAETLLDRLHHIASSVPERERASLTLAAQYLEDHRHADARRVLEACLEGAPSCLAGWVLLEEVAHRELDLPLARRVLTGRAGAAGSDEIESLLYERGSRLEFELGALDEADALLEQALVTYPRWETFARRERTFLHAGRPDRAALVAAAALEHLQAHLDGHSPGGAPLPPLLQSTGEVDAIRLRSALLWASAGDLDRAREHARAAAVAQSAGLFERILSATLAERAGDSAELSSALDAALGAISEADQASRTAIALWQWFNGALGAPVDRNAPPPGLTESPGLLGVLLERAERAENTHALPDLLERVVRLTPRARATDRADLLLAATWIALFTGQTDHARGLLGQAKEEGLDGSLVSAVELGMARHASDADGELFALEQLTTSTSDAKAQNLFAWLTVRRALVLLGPSGTDAVDAAASDSSPRRHLDRALSALLAQPDPPLATRLGAWLWLGGGSERGAEPVFESNEMVRAESIARTLLDESDRASWYERTESALRSSPGDPLLTAVAVRAAEDAAAPIADRVALLQRFAALASSPLFAGAARLRALLLLLKERMQGALDAGGAAPSADQLSALVPALADELELRPLWMWLLRARGTTVPLALTALVSRFPRSEAWLELEGALRRLVPTAPGAGGGGVPVSDVSMLDLAAPPLSSAAQLLELLVAVASGDPRAGDILGDAPELDDHTLGGLLMAAACHGGDPGGQLTAARRFHQLAPGTDSLLAYAVTARLGGQADEEVRVRRALAEELGSPELLAAAQLGGREVDQDRTRRVLGLAEGTEARVKAAIGWELCEATGKGVGPELRGQALELLAQSIPNEIDGPVAQLLSGYQAILAGRDDEAIRLLLPLVDLLPDDSTVHLGLAAAAQRSGRADVEATSCIELARRETEAREAARLWERAGVLLEDRLSQPEQAEAAFQSAMGRVPGSPLSFVRLYQLAHAKRDRPRMIELIDARLEAPADAPQRISLLWEKARHSRHVGRRGAACRALEALLDLAEDHLPALALLAELQLIDQRFDRAAPLLRTIALHPATPADQRESAGLHAVDLLERLALASDALDLLLALEGSGLSEQRTRRRKARLAARLGRWDVAAATFKDIAEEEDDIPTRLEAARMLLAIERDQLRESVSLKDAARLVLRDSPTDQDAAAIVVQENFHPDERARLLGPVRQATLAHLEERPLDLAVIGRMADFTAGTDNLASERAWLGAVALTGRLSDVRSQRLQALTSSAHRLPTGSLSHLDFELAAAPGQLGTVDQLARLVVPKIAKAALPDAEGLGVSEGMRVDPFGKDGLGAELSAWVAALGAAEIRPVVGAAEPGTVLLLPDGTLVLGTGATSPLADSTRARVGYLLFAQRLGVAPLLALGLDESKTWLAAVGRLAARALPSAQPDEVEERAQQLSRLFSSDERAELNQLTQDLERGDRRLTDMALVSLTSAARMATLIHGDPSILRQLHELIPDREDERTLVIGSVIRFLASPHVAALRSKLGLSLA